MCPLVLGSFVNFDCFPEKFDHVKQFDTVVCIFFILKFNKTKVLVLIGYLIAREVNVNNGSRLQEQFPQDLFAYTLVEVPYINSGFLVSFEERTCKPA